MSKYLIVTIAMPIWVGADKNSHKREFDKIAEEYTKKPYNPDFDVFIFEVRFIPKTGYILRKYVYTQNAKTKKAEFIVSKINQYLFDLGNHNILRNLLLVECDCENKKYVRKILVTWSHGFGYSIFSDRIATYDIDSSPINPYNKKNKKELTVTKKGVTTEFAYKLPFRPSILTAKDLGAALNGLYFDALIFSGCYMLTADTIYALQGGVIKYLLGPQTTFSWESYDFCWLISDINTSIASDDEFVDYLKTLASQSIISTPKGGNQVTKSQVSLSIVDFTNDRSIQLFFCALQNIISFFIDHVEDDHDLYTDICNALRKCKDVTEELGLNFIDIRYFLDIFKTKSKYSYTVFNNNMEFIYQYLLDIFYLRFPGSGDVNTNLQLNGMSINFPNNPIEETFGSYYKIFTDLDSQFQTDFSKKMHWGYFLKKFESLK